jgi:vitamin B12 transporter
MKVLSLVRSIGWSRAFVASALLVVPSLGAQQPDTVSLSTVVVTATKTPISRDALTQSVSVITGAELRARGIARVSDALQNVPGATSAQNGSFGSVSSMFLRGGESRYTKVLIDGVAVNQSGGFFDFSHLTTDNVERIEIVRGPASVLYGADAVSGVIQIFTRQGTGPLAADASLRGGTYGTVDGDARVSGASERVTYSLAGAQHRSDGILSFNNQYSNGTLSGSVGLAPNATTDARLSARYTDAEFHYPTDFAGTPVDSNAYRVQHRLTVGLDLGTRISSIARAHFFAGSNEVSDLTEDIALPFGESEQRHSVDRSRGYRRSAEGRVAFTLPDVTATTLTVGGEYIQEKETSTSSQGPVNGGTLPLSQFDAKRSTRAGYAELLGTFARDFSYTAAARVDDNSDYASYTTYRLGASVPLMSGTRLRGSLSTAFNAPAFNQLRPTLYTVGSPSLLPEHIRRWEVAVEHSLPSGAGRLSASYFNQRFGDLIQYVSGGPPSFKGSYANLAEAESNGYEVELQLTPPGVLSGSASMTVATPRVTRISPAYVGDLTVGQALIRRPTHSGTASLTAAPRVGTLTLAANYVGRRPDVDFAAFPSSTVTLPAYTRVDASAVLDIWRSAKGSSLALTARAENALDKQYETVLHFPAPGRVLLIGARFSGSL